MDFIATRRKRKGKPQLYHKQGCPYVKKILAANKKIVKSTNIIQEKYCTCKYCGGLKGDMKIHKSGICKWEKKHNLQFFYREESDALYLRTNEGFWKVIIEEKTMKYLLYHRNNFDRAMSDDVAAGGAFHRQTDVAKTESLQKLVDYIVAHDRAKAIIADDYRKLPQATKQQKKYYRSAERRVKRKARRRLDRLFKMLEREDETLLFYSYC